MTDQESLSAKDAARIKARERKARRPKMVVDNAGVKRVQLALRAKSKKK